MNVRTFCFYFFYFFFTFILFLFIYLFLFFFIFFFFFFFLFFFNPSFKIEMSGRASGVVRGLAFGEPFLKVICYLYSSVDCFHIW